MRKSLFLCCVALAQLVFAPPLFAADVERALVGRIDQARSHLQSTQRRIADQRGKLVDQLNTLEREVTALEKKTAVARRLADEKTLSLSQLQERLDKWRQQQVYQQNLLSRFMSQHEVDGVVKGAVEGARSKATLAEDIAAVTALGDSLQQRLQPAWRDREVILDSGEVRTLPTLSLGPVTWYWLDDSQRAGLASRDDGGLKSAALLGSGASAGIKGLLKQRTGTVDFDPTLGRALALETSGQSPLEHVVRGGLWVIPILLAAAVAVVIALVKGWQLWRLPQLQRFSPGDLRQLLLSPEASIPAAVAGVQRELLTIGLTESSPRLRDDRLFFALSDTKHRLDQGIGAIAITASVSPLLGLLGTVSGMIETFKMMTLFGSGDPEVVSGGIAQALITTELGLVVAIPALILHAVLSRRAKNYYGALENLALLISQVEDEATGGKAVAAAGQERSRASNSIDTFGAEGVPA